MTNEEIAETVEKLKYHISILGQTIDHERHSVEALIIENDWSQTQLNKVHDLFEKWEKFLEAGQQMQQSSFEIDFNNELDISYQDLKSIILAFYRNSQWTNVCEAYVDSFGGSPPIEYHSIMRRNR